MKYRKLLVSAFAFIAALVLIACGIFVPTALLQMQENKILNSQYAYLIDTRELEQSDTTIGVANADPEYLELLYRLRMMNATVNYAGGYTTLEESKENELGRDAAIEKAKQELLRMMELGACPKLDGLDDYVVEQAFLLGYDENIGPNLRDIVLEGMKDWGYDVGELSEMNQRICIWRIMLQHKTEKNREIQITLDAQTGKVYACMIVSDEQSEELSEEYALMFGKYHNLMEYNLSDFNNEGGDSYRFYTCRFDQISFWASFDMLFDENNGTQTEWNFSCALQPAYYY